jgi:hypothetical protein
VLTFSSVTAVNQESVRSVLRSRRVTWLARGVVTTLLLLLSASVSAQGVATAGIRGSVSAEQWRNVDARVNVRNDATGFSVEVHASGGRFLIQGLQPGGPYTITARSLGFVPQRWMGVFLTLGELREIRFVLQPMATRLDTVTVVARGRPAYSPAHSDGGTGTTISASLLERLPTLNRDLYDFVRLVPQISTKISLPNPGLSGGGVGFRFNNFLINGVSERTLSGGVSGAFAGGKSIPLDAVQEYQVLLSPYDVRYGDFAGALVNAVTKSGTNNMRGSIFAYGRNDRLARRAASTPYEKMQYGFSLGGPILRSRLHFFIAPELQDFTYPAAGPYVGQPADAERVVPVTAADLGRFDAIMRSYSLTAGSSGPVENSTPLRNLFTRVDMALPTWNSRLVFWNNYSRNGDMVFSRAARDTFSLSSYQVTRAAQSRTSAVHLHTTLTRAGGGHNELLVSHHSDVSRSISGVQEPIVRVSVPAVSGGRITLNAGTHETAQGIGFRSSAFTIKDNVTLPLRSHVVTLGAEAEHFRLRRGPAGGSYGTWSFASLEDLEHGIADRYEVRIDFGDPDPPIDGTQYAAYTGDQWRASDRLSVTAGIRADMLAIDEHAPYHALVDSLFSRRTDEMPRRRVEFSPRVGFVWDLSGTQREHLRGGLGMFTGRYPLAWAHAALSSYGVGGVLRCSRLSPALQPPPAFNPDELAPPKACAGGSSITTAYPGDVDLLDRNLRMMRVMRGSLAYDWRLPWDIVLTNEALVTRALSDFVLLNLNLADPETTDLYGRVMYGTIGPSGIAAPKRRSAFSEVIDLRNTARNRSYQLSTRLEKTQAAGVSGFMSYTYSRVRDVQTPLRVNTRGTVAWASARVTSGRDDDLSAGISSNDVPHRIVVAGTYVRPWSHGRTELSFYYVGESGRPFTYIAFGTLGRGDLNADGSSANDPVYVPRSALDPLEIQLSGVSDSVGADNSTAAQLEREQLQRNAFENFVERTACLRRQRGQILARNSCREPWSNTMIASLRQAIPIAARAVEVQLDVFNVLNLLNGDWGLRRESAPGLLEHVGQTVEAAQTSRPIFRFNTTNVGWTTNSVESAFQLQLALRYRF